MGRFAYDPKIRGYSDINETISEYFRFCIEFCLEWTKYTEEGLLKKHEQEFFKIFLSAKDRQAAHQKLIEKNNG